MFSEKNETQGPTEFVIFHFKSFRQFLGFIIISFHVISILAKDLAKNNRFSPFIWHIAALT